MGPSAIRLRYHRLDAAIVLVLLAAAQFLFFDVYPGVLALVGVIYLALVVGLDPVRPLDSGPEE